MEVNQHDAKENSEDDRIEQSMDKELSDGPITNPNTEDIAENTCKETPVTEDKLLPSVSNPENGNVDSEEVVITELAVYQDRIEQSMNNKLPNDLIKNSRIEDTAVNSCKKSTVTEDKFLPSVSNTEIEKVNSEDVLSLESTVFEDRKGQSSANMSTENHANTEDSANNCYQNECRTLLKHDTASATEDSEDSSESEETSSSNEDAVSVESSTESDNFALKNKLGTCEVCGDLPAKYTCPRCEIKSCCLTCVLHHKKESDCSGERNKTAFKRLSEFTNLDFLSDYRMLEETTRSVENYKRDPLKYFTRWNRKLPVHLARLRDAVFHRGSKILYLPQHFMRHKNNTTYFDWKTQKLSWCIEWIFPQADFIKVVDERVPEDSRVSTLIQKYLDYNTCPRELQSKLQFYQSAGLRQLYLLLKAEHVKNSSAKFYEVDPAKSLKAALKKKTIIEFPSIYVIQKDHKDMFEIIDSDDQDNEGSQYQEKEDRFHSHQRFHSHPRFRNAPIRQKRKHPKNLLFNESDASDGSLSDESAPKKQLWHRNGNKNHGFHIPEYHDLIRQNP